MYNKQYFNSYCASKKQQYDAVMKQITQKNIGCFKGHSKPLFLISEEYPGVWLEHT